MCNIQHLVPTQGDRAKYRKSMTTYRLMVFSRKEEREKMAQTQIANVRMACLTFPHPLHLDILAASPEKNTI